MNDGLSHDISAPEESYSQILGTHPSYIASIALTILGVMIIDPSTASMMSLRVFLTV